MVLFGGEIGKRHLCRSDKGKLLALSHTVCSDQAFNCMEVEFWRPQINTSYLEKEKHSPLCTEQELREAEANNFKRRQVM